MFFPKLGLCVSPTALWLLGAPGEESAPGLIPTHRAASLGAQSVVLWHQRADVGAPGTQRSGPHGEVGAAGWWGLSAQDAPSK